MEKIIKTPDVSSIASSYVDAIENLIEQNSTWWYAVEGKTDEDFGVAVNQSLEAAKSISEYHSDETALKHFETSLKKVIETGDVLVRSYNERRASRDTNITILFTRAAENHLGWLNKQDTKEFWLLRINGNNWSVDELSLSETLHFHSHRPGAGTMEDYPLFQRIKKGDEGVAYAYGKPKGIVFTFTVTEGLHDDPLEGEIISFQIAKLLTDSIPLAYFADKLSLASSLETAGNVKLFLLKEDEYFTVLSEEPAPRPRRGTQRLFAEPSIANIFTDVTGGKLKDQLDFKSDCIALASVVAYKKFQPPLAIGLFGNWGAGKSFFMNKLRDQIQEFADLKDDKFCHKIVHINFNSWHYSDSNLWASLITKIFEDLEKSGEIEDQDKLKNLFENLNSYKELKVESEQQLQKIQNELNELKKRQTTMEKEIQAQTNNLKNMSYVDIAKKVFSAEDVQKDIAELKVEFDFIKTGDMKQIDASLTELQTTGGKLAESIKILYSFRKGNIWIALAVSIGVLFGSAYLVTRVPYLQEMFNGMKPLIVTFSVFISQALLYLNRATPYVNRLHEKLIKLKKTTEELELQARNEFNVGRDEIQNKITSAMTEEAALKEQIKMLELKKAETEYEIDNIASGKKLIGFIEGRVSDQRYINSLGIISWIRKDFEELDFLLKQQYDARRLAELNRQKVENTFAVDRIILYIDDLDRCEVSVVINVLQAIHLLLAFPLFVVIVGVDPRWMHNALKLKYKGFILNENGNGHRSEKKDEEVTLTNTMLQEQDGTATSFDYLEKIFQIPFVLKPIDYEGKSRLIESNLKGEYYQEDNVITKRVLHTGTDKDIPTSLNDGNGTQQEGKETQDIIASAIGGESTKNIVVSNVSAADKIPQAATSATVANVADKKAMKESSALLEIPDDEIKFMKAISFIVGDSPRAIKRYINIYRIIRAHSGFRFVDENRQEHYYAAMVILGLISTFPDTAGHFLSYIAEESDVTPFFRSYQNYMNEYGQNKLFPVSLINNTDNREALESIRLIRIEKFKINMDLICRFSFRNVTE